MKKPDDFKPIANWPDDHPWHGQLGRCQAWNRNHGRQCMGRAMNGMSVCRLHGGKSLKGIASPSFKNGKYSRYMPPQLSDAFMRVINDPDLLALNVDIATLEARLDELLRSVEGGNPGKLWAESLTEMTGLRDALAREDNNDVMKHLNQLQLILREGAEQIEVWNLILSTTEQKRKLVDTEMKRREKMREYTRSEEVAHYISILLLAIREHVKDEETLSNIADEFYRIIGSFDLPRIESEG